MEEVKSPIKQEGLQQWESEKKVGLGISDAQEALVSQPLHSALLGCLQKKLPGSGAGFN